MDEGKTRNGMNMGVLMNQPCLCKEYKKKGSKEKCLRCALLETKGV